MSNQNKKGNPSAVNNVPGKFQFTPEQIEALRSQFEKRRAQIAQNVPQNNLMPGFGPGMKGFGKNAESFRDPLKGRRSLANELLPADMVGGKADSKVEASGVLTLLQTFDMHDIYDKLNRPQRSQTALSIMNCEFSPNREYIGLALSTGEVEILQYDERLGSVRICYTLIDKDVNKEAVNCTCMSWMPDGRRILAGYTNGFLKLWHVTSKTSLVTRNENNFSYTFHATDPNNLVNEVFTDRTKAGVSTSGSNRGRGESQRQIHCLAYSKPVTMDLAKWLSPSTSDDENRKRAKRQPPVISVVVSATQETKDESNTPAKESDIAEQEDYTKQVTIAVTGGSDGVALVWLLYEPKGINKPTTTGKFIGRQLFLNCACVHKGSKNTMDGHMMNIFAIQFSLKEPSHFFTSGWDSVLFKWDAISGERLLVIKGPLVCGNEAMCMDLETSQSLFLCGDHASGYLDIVDYSDSETLSVATRLLLPKDRFVQPYACAFFGLDRILVGGSNPNCFRIIDRRINASSQDENSSFVAQDSRQALNKQSVAQPSSSQAPLGSSQSNKDANKRPSVAMSTDPIANQKIGQGVSLMPTVFKQGVATVYGSVEDLPQAVTCIGLGPEDKLKKQVIAAGSGSLLMFLNSTVRR
ncbi:uncharacterized protein LOC142348596 isoform X2 [Convolutriloba macropyga]|uniref:uncharacterized protein LOC142348596 isoform X2 n=2 Tax=Convolutriloba macropyga TaxID=536237 RepID=UPI003F52497F